MSSIIIPKNYDPKYGIMETEIAIKVVKDCFEKELSKALDLTRISAPMFVRKAAGINDNLNGVERPVAFEMKEMPDVTLEIVHSLAKWKRIALKQYGVEAGKGIYTDMNAIRRDEDLDNTHSIYVDQWDWEKVISKEDRNLDFLKNTVKKIYQVFLNTEKELTDKFNKFEKFLPKEVTFITSQELENLYPELTPNEREDKFAKEKGAIFIMQIGKVLESGEKHDGRAPDYDDWELNGDLIMWNPILDSSLELSSMGIRVDKTALERQLKELNLEERKTFDFHKMLLNDELPLTIGGGIGQSRICMFLLQKAHIGEVQASVWTPDIVKECKENGINLLWY